MNICKEYQKKINFEYEFIKTELDGVVVFYNDIYNLENFDLNNLLKNHIKKHCMEMDILFLKENRGYDFLKFISENYKEIKTGDSLLEFILYKKVKEGSILICPKYIKNNFINDLIKFYFNRNPGMIFDYEYKNNKRTIKEIELISPILNKDFFFYDYLMYGVDQEEFVIKFLMKKEKYINRSAEKYLALIKDFLMELKNKLNIEDVNNLVEINCNFFNFLKDIGDKYIKDNLYTPINLSEEENNKINAVSKIINEIKEIRVRKNWLFKKSYLSFEDLDLLTIIFNEAK